MDVAILVGIYGLVINLVLFIMMGVDKRRSKRGSWRIKEKKLWGIALAGGVLGGWVGMSVFRHKTKHTSFKLGFPLLSLFYIAGVAYLAYRFYL
ncbi:DUF1294 domain-containing protein [Halobacillus sp. Nhm2S1]|uniref:DUF1294 domain-containing protein n=1 Tax=Halobacillus sp. Nhm2S1 TaxID=2866716 RepID=UPI002106EC30|nr:DUF1294 domain-containing protein [Halobacillus sp. Nhm2S1]